MINARIILFVFSLLPLACFAQQFTHVVNPSYSISSQNNTERYGLRKIDQFWLNTKDSTLYSFQFITGICKGNFLLNRPIQLVSIPFQGTGYVTEVLSGSRAGRAIHGDVTYDFLYRSAIDTPYAATDIAQHSVGINLYTTIKETLPISVHIQMRQSNSPMFKNYIDANVEFDGYAYQSALKDKLKAKIAESIRQNSGEHTLHEQLRNKYAMQQQLSGWLQDNRQIQQLMDSRQAITTVLGNADITEYSAEAWEERAKNYLTDKPRAAVIRADEKSGYSGWLQRVKASTGKLKTISAIRTENAASMGGNLLSDKLDNAIAFVKDYLTRKEKYKKITEEIQQWEDKYRKTKSATRQAIDSARYWIDTSSDPSVLQQQVKKYGLDSNKTYRHIKQWMSIRKFSLGRSMVDHSELTARNISVMGINAEYTNRLFFAVTAGTVDYRYRDFLVARLHKVPQYLFLARAGLSSSKKNSIILTFYQGKKQASWFGNDNKPATNDVTGISVEGKYNIAQNHFFIAEMAKSSYPKFVPVQNNTGTTRKLQGLSDRSNEAYSIQWFSHFPSTQTRISGRYKKLGINFQSFNIFNYNSNYSSWQVKADQYFFRKALFITAAVKNNEYNTPFTIYQYKSNTIFTSVQATLRLKKWPLITAAFMPASQLYKTSDEIIETRFSTLMASVSYMYRLGAVPLHTSVIYNKFFNDRNQQRFMYYNASNWLVNHSIMNENLTLNTAVSLVFNADYRMQTMEESFQYRFNNWLRAGSGLKWSWLNSRGSGPGYSGNIRAQLKKLGELDISFDHGFLPGLNRTLLPNDIGRIIYVKTF